VVISDYNKNELEIMDTESEVPTSATTIVTSSSNRKPNGQKSRSVVWLHFTKVNKEVSKCNYCG
jgi:hypothetical protein